MELEYFRNKQSLLLILQGVLRSGSPGPLLLCCMMTVKRRVVVARREGACSFQLGPVLIIFHGSKNPRWSRKMPFLLRVCSYLSSTMKTGTWSISNVSVQYLLYSFSLFMWVVCLLILLAWLLLAFEFEPADFDAFSITARNIIHGYPLKILPSPLLFFPFSFKKER